MSLAPDGDEVIVPGSFLWLVVTKHTQQVPAMTQSHTVCSAHSGQTCLALWYQVSWHASAHHILATHWVVSDPTGPEFPQQHRPPTRDTHNGSLFLKACI